MGFLSEFRSAAAEKAAPQVAPKNRARRAPLVASEAEPEAPHYAPPARATTATGEIPYYSPTTNGGVEAAPVSGLPESDDYPYYSPPPSVGVADSLPNWSPPMSEALNWAPPSGSGVSLPPPQPGNGAGWTPPYANGATVYPPAGRRRPPAWIIGAVVAAVAVIVGAGAMFVLKSSPSLSGLTADQVMTKMIAAAHKARTFHVEATESQSGQVVHLSIDIGTSGGNISMDGQSAVLRVVDGQVYIKGDASSLSQMGFSDSLAQQYADQWLTIPTTDPTIQQMAESLDGNQIIDQFLHLSEPLTRIPSGAGGGVTLQGTVPDNQFNQGSGAGDTANLVVSSKAPFVPMSISFSDPSNGSTQMTFSHWGERVQLVAPTNPISLPASAGSS